MNNDLEDLYSDRSPGQLAGCLVDACCLGRLDRVKYLITKKDVDINFNNDQPFREACRSQSFDIVEYLLTSTELQNHSNINNGLKEHEVSGLSYACVNGDISLVKYLLSSPNLKEHANVHEGNDNAFKLAFYREKEEVLKYLIFDYKIPYTDDIKEHLQKVITYNGNMNYHKHIDSMFLARELNEELTITEHMSKKIKL
jgi:ankyrin repeat protein